MQERKEFRIRHSPGGEQFINTTNALGRVLLREEVDDIVGRYGSVAKKALHGKSIDVVPPIHRKHLDELGKAFVELAKSLDPTDPEPTYKIE